MELLANSVYQNNLDIQRTQYRDIKQYIGLPNAQARYDILASCLRDLGRVGIISPPENFRSFQVAKGNSDASHAERILVDAATKADGLSGRALRKIPFQAHAFFCEGRSRSSGEVFCKALVGAIERELQSRVDLTREKDETTMAKK